MLDAKFNSKLKRLTCSLICFLIVTLDGARQTEHLDQPALVLHQWADVATGQNLQTILLHYYYSLYISFYDQNKTRFTKP